MKTITITTVTKRVITTDKEFKVICISSNHNSFGLKGFIAVARDGMVFEAAANYLNIPKAGQVVKVTVDNAGNVFTAAHEWEIPKQLPDCPPDILKKIWGS